MIYLHVVATVLTVYGIETGTDARIFNSVGLTTSCNSTYRLRYWNLKAYFDSGVSSEQELQQYLPFTVLKLNLHQ